MDDPTSRYTPPEPAAPSPPGPPPPAQTAPPPTQPASTPLPPAEPTWRPPPVRDHGRNASVVIGVIIVIIGLWYFAGQTLGLDLPDLEWSQLWPLILIVIGAWIVFRATRRTT